MIEVQSRAPGAQSLAARVGIVSFDFFPSYGGQGRHTYDLWRHLRALDVDVRVLSPRANQLPGHSRGGAFSLKAGQSLAFSVYASLAVSRWRRRNEIGLLHVNGGPGGVILLNQPDTRLVYTAHHTYAQQARNVPGQTWKQHLARLQARAYRHADVVTADTPSTAESLRDELGLDDSRVRVVASGFDADVFKRVKTSAIEGSALYVGRLDSRKGFDFLIDAWIKVASRASRARLFVIGRGPLEASSRRRLDEEGVSDSVVFLDRQSEAELVSWYNRVSVVAVPSRFEGFGLTALESMACGTRVVATDTEGLRDVVINGADGRLVPFGDSEAMAFALLEELRAPSHIKPRRLREVRAQYAWPRVAPRFLQVYQEAIRAA
jgi:glycosyltransferase involved in cell wall biosynthesis